jgi:hypothetical protein
MREMIMKRLMISGIAICTVVLASCASTGGDIPKVANMLRDTTGQNGRACVRQSDIQGYGVLENDVVSIDGTRKYYLATVLPGCIDLQTSVRALFSGGFGEVCGGTMNKIVTRGDQCTINQMFEFENRKAAFDTYNSILEQRKTLKSSTSY